MATYLITGANRGIGLALSEQLKAAGHQLIAAVRKASPELQEVADVVHEGVDVCAAESISALAGKLENSSIDVLINNAGLLISDSLDSLDPKTIRQQFEVNSLGPLMVTHGLRSKLAKDGKVAIVTSRMGSMADNSSGGMYGYRMSKAAVNMAGVSLAQDLRNDRVAVGLLHPGFVRTRMTGNNGLIDADESARGLIERIKEINLENSGRFVHQNGEELPW